MVRVRKLGIKKWGIDTKWCYPIIFWEVRDAAWFKKFNGF